MDTSRSNPFNVQVLSDGIQYRPVRSDERPGLSLNAVVCLGCFSVIESVFRWQHVTCCCGKVTVGGGMDYLKRSFMPDADWIDISYDERGLD